MGRGGRTWERSPTVRPWLCFSPLQTIQQCEGTWQLSKRKLGRICLERGPCRIQKIYRQERLAPARACFQRLFPRLGPAPLRTQRCALGPPRWGWGPSSRLGPPRGSVGTLSTLNVLPCPGQRLEMPALGFRTSLHGLCPPKLDQPEEGVGGPALAVASLSPASRWGSRL